MRLIMMGTGPFALPTFAELLEFHDVAVLVTRPTPPVRSRSKAPHNPMREYAERHGIQVLAPDDVNSAASRTQLAALRPDLLVVCDYGQILSAETLSVAPLGGINLHASLLPKYRGAAPVNWAILDGAAETGVTVLHMTPKLDAGPCLVQRVTPIGTEETAGELEPRLAKLGVEAVREALAILAAWDGAAPLGTPQDASRASRAPRLKKSDGEVDWRRSAKEIHNQVRALQPWPGTFTCWQRQDGAPMRLILEKVRFVPDVAGDAGTVVRSDGGELWIATGTGALSLERIQPAGKRVMPAAEFLRGYPIAVADRFG